MVDVSADPDNPERALAPGSARMIASAECGYPMGRVADTRSLFSAVMEIVATVDEVGVRTAKHK